MSHVSHKQALEEAIVEYEQWATHRHAIEASIKKYIDARGLVMVPKEPTQDMVDAAWDAEIGEIYTEMLAAAPDPFQEASE